jgi:transposase-like protein
MEYAVKTLQQAIQHFADRENCRKFMVFMRWPDGTPRCPYCGATKLSWLEKANVYQCYGAHAKKKFSLKVGTIFEDSPIGLDKWLPAMWLLTNNKNGISSYELHRALGVTQKTAWFMLHRIRLALQSNSFMRMGQEGGPVEVDEVFIGGKPKNMHAKRRAALELKGPRDNKTAVMGCSTGRPARYAQRPFPTSGAKCYRQKSSTNSCTGPRSSPMDTRAMTD